MREQYHEVSAGDARKCIPARVLEQVDAESERILDLLTSLISYADDVRVLQPEGGRISLSELTSDEQAVALFRHLLEEEPVQGVLLGTKVRKGRTADTLFGYMKKHTRLRISAEELRTIGCRIEDLADGTENIHSARFTKSGRPHHQNYLVGGIASLPNELGRAAVTGLIADKVGRSTKILHAAAARYQLMSVEQMLDLYDSIHDASLGHVPDLFPAARKIHRHFVIHVGGTNTGKTHDAMQALANAPSGVYLCPLRMLAYEGRAVIESYGVPCSFATGEEKELKAGAKHISETIGMLDFSRKYDMAVIDECQLISGEDGSLYTNAILGVCADVVQVCCAWPGLDITKRLITLCGDDYQVVEHFRTSELKFEDEPYRGPRRNDAYIVFSRLGAYEMSGWLEKHGMHPSIVYGKLPYEVKMEEARKFERGDTDCLVATDAIAIGQNYNIQRIIFRDTVKHINRKEVELDSQTVKQVAGRAGRYGRFPVGYVNTFEAKDRDQIRHKLEEDDLPSKMAPLELPSFLVDVDLPLSLIYKAWNEAEAGEPFVKADTTVELYICRLIETRYGRISKRDEYSLAGLPLDLKDKDQETLLDNLLYLFDKGRATDEEWKILLPDRDSIHKIVKYRPHMMTLEKLCRQLDLASSFFYKIRREDLADYVIKLKPPVTKRIAEIMAEQPTAEKPADATGSGEKSSAEQPGAAGTETAGADSAAEAAGTGTGVKPREARQDMEIPAPAEVSGTTKDITKDTGSGTGSSSDWPTAYIYVSVSGQSERNTGRYPYGDYSRLYSRELRQSYGNEATYIDYYCYKRKTRTPDYCRFEPYLRYTVKLDPKYIVSDEGPYLLAEKFQVVKCDYMHSASPMRQDRPEINSRSQHYRNNRNNMNSRSSRGRRR